MKLDLENNFITDNSLECQKGCYFVKTKSNAMFEEYAKKIGAIIITPSKAYELAKIPKNLQIIGITGTNGKTTTATLIAHILNELGYKSANCGTRGAFIKKKQILQKALTTNQFLTTLSLIKQATNENCKFFVMEVSSHAIAQDRIQSLPFALKVFTNLSQDHLDYHKTFEEYALTKSSFFADSSLKLINQDDKNIKFSKTNTHFYGLNCDEYSICGDEIKVDNLSLKFNSHLYGKFNLYNILCAFASVDLLVKNQRENIISAIASFSGVEGRTELVSKNPIVIVDFAHTPDGVQKVLESFYPKPLIVVMGAGGDRDNTKRPIMGEIAAKYAKMLIITSDNPRGENPQKIIEQIKIGAIKYEKTCKIFTQIDRKEAIKFALQQAKDEIVAILGKGDETYQEINGVKYPFSDTLVVKELLNI